MSETLEIISLSFCGISGFIVCIWLIFQYGEAADRERS